MVADAYRGLEPVQLWRHFAALNAIPRPSGHESQARDYVLGIARDAGADSRVDRRGNTVIRVPASTRSDGPAVAIQAHLDMVCEADSGVVHDCERDPILPRRDGDRIFASGTTLGADNGIGVAACLALIDARHVRHGDLELIFTVEEESGRWSALDLDASLLKADVLINLDSEEADALTIGSAGGSDVDIAFPLPRESPAGDLHSVELRVEGLRGGHSGMQIHEPRANAIKLIVEALERLRGAGLRLWLSSIDGGSAHTAIPHAARAGLSIAPGDLPRAQGLVEELRDQLSTARREAEPELTIELSESERRGPVIADRASAGLLGLLSELPHGVVAMSKRYEDVVETSANLAAIHTEDAEARVFTSVRSLLATSLAGIQARVRELAVASGAAAEIRDEYPSWEPRERSPLLDATVRAYEAVYGGKPRLNVIHGGLECGAIIAKRPSLDAISFGPLIREAHTPTEHVYASTVTTTWELLISVLDDMAYDD